MSREIKFAFWHNWKKEMWGVDSINWVYKEVWNGGDGASLNDGVLLQYTGFVDKNGKEIYEGDIITVFDYCDDGDIITTKASEVKFKNGSFGFKNDITRDFYSFSNCNRPGTSFKIIGNKFENPELITEVKNG